MFLLNGQCIYILRLTGSELQRWVSSSKGTGDIGGRTELSGIKVRTGGAAFSWTEQLAELAEFIVPFLNHTHKKNTHIHRELAGRCHMWDPINLADAVIPTLVFP